MIVRDKVDGYPIHGELYSVSYETLEQLDHLEGTPHHYYRSSALITLDGDEQMLRRTAYIYVYAQKIGTQTEIPSGEWKGR